MHFTFVVPDGVGVRNFIFGDLLKLCCQQQSVTVLHAIPPSLTAQMAEELPGGVEWRSLAHFAEGPLTSTIRYALEYAQMYWADTRAMRYRRSLPTQGSWKRCFQQRAARLAGRASATPARMRLLNGWYCRRIRRTPEVAQYRRLFEETKTQVLFCSNQRAPAILPAVLAAQELHIPAVTFVFSWDNLTSKGRIAAPFDHYLVWSDHMRQELLHYYPYLGEDRIHVVGAPQFDCYANDELVWSRAEFCRRIGADPTRPLICYSGGDVETCPEEPAHARILMDLVRRKQIRGEAQVLLRPAPVDDGRRFSQLCEDYSELIFAAPAWMRNGNGTWSHVMPQMEDVQFLANLTRHADVNVNVASTMTLDFALHNKPVVNVAFDVATPPPFGVSLWEFFYQFEHYRPVVELGAARFARSPTELAEFINMYLENPAVDRAGRLKLVELEVGAPLGHAGKNIFPCLRSIAGQQNWEAHCPRHGLRLAEQAAIRPA